MKLIDTLKKQLDKRKGNIKKENVIYVGVLLVLFILFFSSEREDQTPNSKIMTLNDIDETTIENWDQFIDETEVRNRLVTMFIDSLVNREFQNMVELFDPSMVETLYDGNVEHENERIDAFGLTLTRNEMLYDAELIDVNENNTIYTIEMIYVDDKTSSMELQFNPVLNLIAVLPEVLTDQVEENLKTVAETEETQ